MEKYKEAAKRLKEADYVVFYTGAGISVESGIPPFRGESGLWGKYDPKALDLNNYFTNTEESWKIIKEIFYDFFGESKPNDAHKVIGRLENKGIVKAVITQNIDNLHQEGGSTKVLEYHGNSKKLICTKCNTKFSVEEINMDTYIPICKNCKGLLKPDFVFFGEMIPEYAANQSYIEARNCDLMFVIGSTGEVVPAAYMPHEAKQTGAFIIEINPGISSFTNTITDLHIKEKASVALMEIEKELNKLI